MPVIQGSLLRSVQLAALATIVCYGCTAATPNSTIRCGGSDELAEFEMPKSDSKFVVSMCLPRSVVARMISGGRASEGIVHLSSKNGLAAALTVLRPPGTAAALVDIANEHVRKSELYGLTLGNPPLAAEIPIERKGKRIGIYVEARDSLALNQPVAQFGAFGLNGVVVVFSIEYNQSHKGLLRSILGIDVREFGTSQD